MSNVSEASEPSRPSQRSPLRYVEITDKVPLISDGVKEWGCIPLGIGAIVVAAEADHLGHLYGPFDAWALVVLALSAMFAGWWVGRNHRKDAQRARLDRTMYEHCQMTAIKEMSGRDFEHTCARLLKAQGYNQIEVIGSTPDEQGADIIALNADGYGVAIQCKRQKTNVGVKIVRELIGTVNSGRHHGRIPMLMTNATLTRGARALAELSEVIVIDQSVLPHWVLQARRQIEKQGSVEAQLVPSARSRKKMRPAARFAWAVCCSAFLLMIIIGIQAVKASSTPTTTPQPKTTSTPTRDVASSAADPSTVVKTFFNAISAHAWAKVWRIGGKNLGRGPYTSYDGMIAGYQGTVRDVPLTLAVKGDLVSGRMLAYEADGSVRTYKFSYTVRGTVIFAGSLQLLHIDHPSSQPDSPRG